MSEQSWRKEFYPVSADAPSAQLSELAAVRHSLRKWRGVLPEALSKHGLERVPIGFGGTNCALCVRHTPKDGANRGFPECGKCVLSKLRGGHACDDERSKELTSPWHAWLDDRNPRPMLRLLRRAERHLSRKTSKS